MSDYSNTFGGAAKDSANDTVLGAQMDTQCDNVATMSATKANKVTTPTVDNLVVMTAAGDMKDEGLTLAALKDLLEPIGTIFHSTSSTNPGTSKGFGTWTQISKGRVLIGEGAGAGLTSRTAAAEIGTEDSVVVAHQHDATGDHGHTSAGAHTHTQSAPNYTDQFGNTGGSTAAGSASTATTTSDGAHTHPNAGSHQHASEGVSGVDQNIQPALVVYIFERTA